jgi:signal transduction histidine kinase
MSAGLPDEVPCVTGSCDDLKPVAFEHTDETLSKDRVVFTHDHPGGGRLVHGKQLYVCRGTTCSPRATLETCGDGAVDLTPQVARLLTVVRVMTSILRRASRLQASGAAGELAVALAATTVAVAICTALIYPLKQVAPVDSLAVVYMVAVLLISATWGLWFGVIAALASVLAFDYFQLPPPGSLSLRDGKDWVASATFVIAATVGGYGARVAHSRSELIASRRRIIAAADAARERLARDLHDGAQQRLVTTVVNLQLADQQFERDAQGARELLQAALAEAGDALAELRELAHGVHPSILTNRGLGAAAAALADRSPLPVEVAVGDERYPPHVEAAAYFFIAEALTNVVKHAHATHAELNVRRRDGDLVIEVRDDGVGGADSAGSGIRGLRDRIEALGGQIQIASPLGRGTHIHAAIAHPGTLDPDR